MSERSELLVRHARIVDVLGGTGGGGVVEAWWDELHGYAAACVSTADQLTAWTGVSASLAEDTALAATAALAPATYLAASLAIGATRSGPRGLLARAASWGPIAGALHAVASGFDEVEGAVVRRAAALGASLYGPESGTTTVPVLAQVADSDVPPRDLVDVIEHLEEVDLLAREGPEPRLDGAIDVQTLTGAGGVRRHIVYLPGTDDMTTLPGHRDADVRDMDENLRLIAGEPTDYGRGVLDAMRQAGVRRGEPVLLVGHSQGGMEAAALASERTGFTVTDVVTVGAPTAQVASRPRRLHVLSIDNAGDAVPLAAGRPDRGSPGQVTVEIDTGETGVVDEHDLSRYVAGAEALDASNDPTVRGAVGRLSPFLGAESARGALFQIDRR